MSAFLDEQAEEIEVLQSIFPTEFELKSTNPNIFQIHLAPAADEAHGKSGVATAVYSNVLKKVIPVIPCI
jgi:RWD domain